MPGSRRSLLLALTAVSIASGTSALARSAPLRDQLHTLSAPLPAAKAVRPLPFFYDLYTFRGSGDSTTVVAAYAVEADELETEEAGSNVRYRFSVTLVLADTAARSVSNTHDTVFVEVPRPLPGSHLLYTHVELLAPPSRSTLHRVLMIDATTPGIGQLYSDGFPIPDYSGDRLMLSDIALAQPDAGSGWRRADATLALLPASQSPTGAFDVYYEVYNLPAGTPYRTEIAVEQVGGSEADPPADGRPVRLAFSGEATVARDGSVPQLRRVDTSLPRGSYRITVTITNQATGETASRSRPFEVRGRERGATLVAALPLRIPARAKEP